MKAPTIADLLTDPVGMKALEDAWSDSQPGDPAQCHEEGGWIFMDLATGQLLVRRAQAGSKAAIDLNQPPLVQGATIVAKFHTHPNPSADGWIPGPSNPDHKTAALHGVPSLIRADNRAGQPARRPGQRPWISTVKGESIITKESQVAKPLCSSDQALQRARLDAEKAYGDLSLYRITILLESDGWHIDYDLKDSTLDGGGPHYVIDSASGNIVSKRYEQ
jgi:hypothetical protein